MLDAPIRLLNQWSRLRFFLRRTRLHIPPGSLVLDVGSGDNPHGRADVLCDRYPVSPHYQRPGAIVIDRPFVVADAQRLPFRDNAFDYVICSQMLEHPERPDRVLDELSRVGRAGYIETVSIYSEKLGGMVDHHWFVDVDDQTLVMRHKPRPAFDDHLHCNFHFHLWQRNAAFMFFYWRNPALFFNFLEWQGRILYRIEEPSPGLEWPQDEDVVPNVADLSHPSYSPRGVKWAIKRLLYGLSGQSRPRRTIDLAALLACPLCRGPLRLEQERADCSACRARFPVHNGVPILLAEAASPKPLASRPVAEG